MNKTAILLAFAAALCTASCKKNDNNETVAPATPTYGYSFDDQFSDTHNGWSSYNPLTTALITISDGNLHYVYHTTKDTFSCFTVNPYYDTKHDFAITASVHSDNAIGLAFGVNLGTFGYAFELDNNGRYALFAQGDTKTPRTTIFGWTTTPAAKPGFYNKLELDQVGTEWYGYVNDVRVFSTTARPLSISTVGFSVEANTNADADYINVKWN